LRRPGRPNPTRRPATRCLRPNARTSSCAGDTAAALAQAERQQYSSAQGPGNRGCLAIVLAEGHRIHVPVAPHVGDQPGIVDPVCEHPTNGAGQAALEPAAQHQDMGDLVRRARRERLLAGDLQLVLGDVAVEELADAGLAADTRPSGLVTASPIGSSTTTSSAINANQPSRSRACTQRHDACDAASAGVA
jgi:hypothetical protein